MHRARVNQCDLTLTIKTTSPVTFIDGRYEKKSEKKGPQQVLLDRKAYDTHAGLGWPADLMFPNTISVSRNTHEEIVSALKCSGPSKLPLEDLGKALNGLRYYIPGASLRGMLRSHAEKILRTLSPGADQPVCCDPFMDEQDPVHCSCGKHLEKASSKLVYRSHCPVCTLFGSTRMAGRIRFEDFDCTHRGRTVMRDSVALSRFTGGVVQGPFRTMLLEDYAFSGRLTLLNFQCWHLGLVAYLLRDLCFGQLRLGWGKSKGYGEISATVDAVHFQYFGSGLGDPPNVLPGIEHLGFADEVRTASEAVSVPGLLAALPDHGPFRFSYRVNAPEMSVDSPFWSALAATFNQAVQAPFPPLGKLRLRAQGGGA